MVEMPVCEAPLEGAEPVGVATLPVGVAATALGSKRQMRASAAAATSTQTSLGAQSFPRWQAEAMDTGKQKPPTQFAPVSQELSLEQVNVSGPVPKPTQTLSKQRRELPQSAWAEQPRPRPGMTPVGRTLWMAELGMTEETAEASWDPALSMGVRTGPAALVTALTSDDTAEKPLLRGGSRLDKIGLAADPMSLTTDETIEMGALAAEVTSLRTLDTTLATSPAPELIGLRMGSRGEPLLPEPAAEVAEASTEEATLWAAEAAELMTDATGLPDPADAAAEAAALVACETIDSTAEAPGMSS